MPRFLRHAPHLIYGAPTDETVQWNVSLAASLGASQLPVVASLSPSGTVQGVFRTNETMRIQGSCRAYINDRGFELDNGMMVWTLEENSLLKSGLPREFSFVMLADKTPGRKVLLDIDIDPEISTMIGHYPLWWTKLAMYAPVRISVDLDREVGEPFKDKEGREVKWFNFAELDDTFDEFVKLPGTTYTTTLVCESGGSCLIQADLM